MLWSWKLSHSGGCEIPTPETAGWRVWYMMIPLWTMNYQHSTVSSASSPHSTFGTRAFSVAGPRVWNSQPVHLRDTAVDPSGNNLVETLRRRRICSLDIRSISALEVLRSRALHIDVYLLTYRTQTSDLWFASPMSYQQHSCYQHLHKSNWWNSKPVDLETLLL